MLVCCVNDHCFGFALQITTAFGRDAGNGMSGSLEKPARRRTYAAHFVVRSSGHFAHVCLHIHIHAVRPPLQKRMFFRENLIEIHVVSVEFLRIF